MTRPDRSAVSVTGTLGVKDWLNAATQRAAAPDNATTNMVANHSDAMRGVFRRAAIALSGEVELTGLAIDRQRYEQDQQSSGDQRGSGGAPHRLPHTGRAARGGVSVVRVNQHDGRRRHGGDGEGADHVRGNEEGVEVVVVDTGRLTVYGGRAEARGEVGKDQRHTVERQDDDDSGHESR